MIVFGTSNKMKTVGSGQFHCPNCRTMRAYERKQAKRYFSLYFIPLIPMGDLGEFVECQTCHLTFRPEVLTVKPPEPTTDLAVLINSAKARLGGSHPIEYFVRDLNAAGLEREAAWSIVTSAIGSARRVCPNCDLSYAATVTTCRECSRPLGD